MYGKIKNMKQHYDILLVGAGLFNATLAYHFIKQNKSVLVVEKRNHIAGNCYDKPGYGGGFSALPSLITKHYGITKTSTKETSMGGFILGLFIGYLIWGNHN